MLIVLDACRYDVFSKVIYKYLDGKLKAVISPASVTIDWLKTVWLKGDWKDTIYVSATPMVNKRTLLKSFDAKHILYDIVEVWDWGWSDDLGTVPPDRVNFGVKVALFKAKLKGLKFPGMMRLVVHYVQPHSPYVILQNVLSKLSKHELIRNQTTDFALRKLGRFTGKFSIDHIILGILKDYFQKRIRDLSTIIRHLYMKNLSWVLDYVSDLVTNINGKVVITSDHGELLGEYGLFFHMDLPLPQLRIVPWFEVK